MKLDVEAAETAEVDARELSRAEWLDLLESQVQRDFGMTAEQFALRLDSGELDAEADARVARAAMLLPSVR